MSYQSVIATVGAIAAIGFFISLVIAMMMPTQRSSPCSLYESSLGNSDTEEGYIRNRRTGLYLQAIPDDTHYQVGPGFLYGDDGENRPAHDSIYRHGILGTSQHLFTRDSTGVMRANDSRNARITSDGLLEIETNRGWKWFSPHTIATTFELVHFEGYTPRSTTISTVIPRFYNFDVTSPTPYYLFEWVPRPNKVAWGVCQANTVCPEGYACRDSGNGQPRCLTEGDCRWAQGADNTTSPNNCSAIVASTIVVPNQTAWGRCQTGTVCPTGYACRDSGNGEPRCLKLNDCRWAEGVDHTTSPNGCSAMSM